MPVLYGHAPVESKRVSLPSVTPFLKHEDRVVDTNDSMPKQRTRGRKKASFGILFWLAFLLLVLVVFLYNRSTIESVMESTGLVDVLRDRFGDEEEPEVVQTLPEEDGTAGDDGEPDSPRIVNLPPEEEVTEPAEEGDNSTDSSEPPSQPAEETEEPKESAEPSPRSRESNIFFIRVTDQGTIYPEGVVRTVTYTNNPMTETLNSLLEGPTRAELNLGLLNLIPDETRLLSAAVRDRVAYLNFSEEFRFNPMGFEGLMAQLQQIVYSTTEFSTVEEVQILIEGELVDYLGVEGVYIGAPLSRDSFG